MGMVREDRPSDRERSGGGGGGGGAEQRRCLGEAAAAAIPASAFAPKAAATGRSSAWFADIAALLTRVASAMAVAAWELRAEESARDSKASPGRVRTCVGAGGEYGGGVAFATVLVVGRGGGAAAAAAGPSVGCLA